MSLSTLGAQLAALNGPGNNGSALPTSRRHDDAIGRGMGHSVQVGHTIANKSHVYKASILYEDARKASDVPLATIRENCVASLRQLESVDPEFGTFIDPLCKQSEERGLLTPAENDKVDQLIQDLLFRLALRMDSKSTVASCLHVIEFLLRRYDMHLRPKIASTTLLVVLPHHEQAFFLRLLQLMDLASMPTWSFLRPYAVPNAKVGRDTFAKQASKDVAFLRELCKLAQRQSQLPNHTQSLSFLAAVIVEGMTSQLRTTGSLDERTCQTLLPYIVAACRQSQRETYQQWGHVLASTLVETSVLAEEPRNVLVASILQGLTKGEAVVSSGLVVALTVLAQPLDDLDARDYQFLPGYGYSMDKNVLQALLKLESVATRLGQLYAEDGFVDFAPWIASILVVGWKRLQKKKEGKRHQKLQQLVLDLIQEPRLQQMWKDKWIESFAAFCLTNTKLPEPKSEDETYLESVLQALRRLNTVAYEKGLTQALLKTKKDERDALATWLGLKNNMPNAPQSIVLPPRVALEHADVEVRMEAISRVLQEEADEDAMDVGGETVQQALLRRFMIDDDEQIVLKSTKALNELLDKNMGMNPRELAEGSLSAIYQWAEQSKVDKATRPLLIVQGLRILSHAGQGLVAEGETGELFIRLVETTGAYLADSNKHISLEAAKSIAVTLKGKSSKASEKDARHLLVSKEELWAGFHRRIGKARRSEQIMRRRLVPTLLKAFSESFGPRAKKHDASILTENAVAYCVWTVTAYSKDLNETEQALITGCLSSAAKHIASTPKIIPSILTSLAECDSDIFSKVQAPAVKAICDNVKNKNKDAVPGISVVMEVLLASSSSLPVENLLTIAKDYIESEPEHCHYGFAPALALLSHADEDVRKKAVDLICVIDEALLKVNKSPWSSICGICQYVSENRSSAILGGSSFLPGCLASSVDASKKALELQRCVLSLAVYAAAAYGSTKSKLEPGVFDKGWLDISITNGGFNVAMAILQATESAGEAAFPVAIRWQFAGKPILEGLSQLSESKEDGPSCLPTMVDSVVKILKGIKVMDPRSLSYSASSTIITSGPAHRGGRARSYSFGKNDNVSFLHPYPNAMHETIVFVLTTSGKSSHSRTIRNSLFRTVLGNQAWSKDVFSNLPRAMRHEICTHVLVNAIEDLADGADDSLFSLSLDPIEVADLLKTQKKSSDFLSAITYLADYSSANALRLVENASASDLFCSFFDNLSSLSSKTSTEDEAAEFARQSLLAALNDLVVASNEHSLSKTNLGKNKKFKEWTALLVGLLGGAEYAQVVPLVSLRSKRTALALLNSLCEKYPASAADCLIPAMVTTIAGTQSSKEAAISAESFRLIVPAYFKHAGASNGSAAKIFNAFISTSQEQNDEEIRNQLYQGFVDALATIRPSNGDSISLVGAMISACLAGEVHFVNRAKDDKKTSLSQLSTQMLGHTSILTKVSAVWTMLNYGKDLIMKLMDQDSPLADNDVLSIYELVSLVKNGPLKTTIAKRKNSTAKEVSGRAIQKLCTVLMVAVSEAIASLSFRKFVRQVQGDTSTLILRLWQDLLMIQSACHNYLGGASDKEMGATWESITEITNEALESLQSNLPAHIFLAFATSLIREGGTEELRARAVQLVADRSLTLKATDPEAALFRDMLPFLTGLLKNHAHPSRDIPNGKILQQSALVAIENIARALCRPSDGIVVTSTTFEQFSIAISRSSELIETASSALDETSGLSKIDKASRQLVCSAALCAATTIRVCGARALPTLPKLMTPLIKFLSAANNALGSAVENRFEASQARLMQLSVLRSLCSVAEVLPQFLAPYLGSLFRPSGLPSEWLRKETDEQSLSVKSTSERLSNVISSHVPARQLIPAASNALPKSLDASGIQALLSILTASVKESKGAQLRGQLTILLKAATFVFDFGSKGGDRESLVQAANELLLSLILKLSEVQLRSLYTKLREWRGDLDKSDPSSESARRRVTFWGFSACLGKQLKSIYLPCLTSVFSDAVDELDFAAAVLCKRDVVKVAGGTKKQRLDNKQETKLDQESLHSLQSLFLCLEVGLRSDAHDGGVWIREGGSQRFNLILEPLGKLLHCKIAAGEDLEKVSYQSIIQGDNDDKGSVVNCIVALASAAGDEQLWKPLNHAVLQACSNESRSEVRKAGVTCLLSLIRSIGEEYMVLVPECLPVLSELLEDSDEETAGLAQDCISISEELLGESLQESLR